MNPLFLLSVPRLCVGMAIALLLAGCASRGGQASANDCPERGADVVCTAQGAVRGVAEGTTLAFKGIPYAKPPVGTLRWRAPEAPGPWQGVRDGSRFGAVCPQLAGKEVIGDEDCLTLNIWKPRRAGADRLPVMVFLTGGGNHAFSGQGSPGFGGGHYNGERLVQEDVVYVSFNNRLGALGFLAHPALDAERPERVSGNYGNLDQIAMLRWLRQNIAAFGGDPQRIMLFGTSAGGGNICALLAAPAAHGLFHAAALQSSVPTGCELPTLADVENTSGRQVVEALGCGGKDAAACLRGKSAAEVVRALPGSFGLQPRLYGPNMDGVVFPEQPIAAIRRGAHAQMPVIIGNSSEETMQWAAGLGPVRDEADYRAAIAKAFGAQATPRIVARYPLSASATPHAALVKLTTDAYFTCQSHRVAHALARSQQEPVYRYLFAHALQNDPALKAQGAIHTVEHMFFFPWQGSYRPTPDDLAIQRSMVRGWTQLARSGALTEPNDPAWLPVTRGDTYLQIGAAPRLGHGAADAHCDLWESVTLPWPHM